MRIVLLSSVLVFLAACGNDDSPINFNQSVQLGKEIFNENCTVCHGNAGQGLVKNWKNPLSNGKYPPPPLNGTAHAWHHSSQALLEIINQGGIKFGGTMPGFNKKLDNQEKQALIDYMYSLWPEGIRRSYDKRFK